MMESVASWHEVYLSRSNLRPASVEIKRRVCNFFCEAFGDPPIGRVTAAMAEDFRVLLGRGRSQVSVNGYLNNFRPFWTWAMRHGYVVGNPFAYVGPVELDESPPKETFRPSELARLMKTADAFWRVRICLGLMGCRRGEMLHVQARDCHLSDPSPYILIGYHRADRRTIVWGVKGKKLRYVGLPDRMGFDGVIVPLRQHVEDRIAVLGDEAGYLCLEDRYVGKLLAAQAAGTLDWSTQRDPTGNFPRAFRSIQERAGIRTTRRYHELRAAFATSMIDEFGLGRAAELLGHASVETTRKYDRKTKLSLVAEAARIAASTYVTKVS